MVDNETSFFLHVPTSQYDPTPKTRSAILQDTGTLLTMPEDLACVVLDQVEGHTHNFARNHVSDEHWGKVQTVGNRLAMQHPDHVTNVIRLWKKVMVMKGEDVRETTVKDLGLLLQHRNAEAVVILENLAIDASGIKVEEDGQIVVLKDDDEGD